MGLPTPWAWAGTGLVLPSSPDVVACAGALASGSDPEKQLGAEFCAACNRGVPLDTSAWYTPSAYYTRGIKNDYAAFLHTVGLDRRAHAFPYDGIDDSRPCRSWATRTRRPG
jgi:hypothetical protein